MVKTSRMDSARSPDLDPHVYQSRESDNNRASHQTFDESTIVASPVSEALDHGRGKPGRPKRAISEGSVRVGEVLPSDRKVRDMIEKLLPRRKRDRNGFGNTSTTSAGALVGREHLGCEVVHEGEGDIRAEYVPKSLVVLSRVSIFTC